MNELIAWHNRAKAAVIKSTHQIYVQGVFLINDRLVHKMSWDKTFNEMVEIPQSLYCKTIDGAATKAANGVPNADYDTFIKLLVAQMKNQDPTKPMDSTEFVSQLASFSAVEQAMQTNTKLENTNAKLDDILINGPISQAEGYVGKYIKFDDGKGNVVEGTVQSVTIYSDGLTAKLDNGKDVIIGPGITVSNNKPEA